MLAELLAGQRIALMTMTVRAMTAMHVDEYDGRGSRRRQPPYILKSLKCNNRLALDYTHFLSLNLVDVGRPDVKALSSPSLSRPRFI